MQHAQLLDSNLFAKTPTRRSFRRNISRISLSGLLIPWVKMIGGRRSEFKLVCSSGLEYSILSGPEWREILRQFSWREISLNGFLNLLSGTLVPRKVVPKSPIKDGEKIIDLAARKSRYLIQKLLRNVNDFVLIPAALWAIIAQT